MLEIRARQYENFEFHGELFVKVWTNSGIEQRCFVHLIASKDRSKTTAAPISFDSGGFGPNAVTHMLVCRNRPAPHSRRKGSILRDESTSSMPTRH